MKIRFDLVMQEVPPPLSSEAVSAMLPAFALSILGIDEDDPESPRRTKFLGELALVFSEGLDGIPLAPESREGIRQFFGHLLKEIEDQGS